ncbi:MAG: amidase family protein [Frankiaceae bacterium]
MNELCTKGAGELAGMIAAGEATSAEVVDAHLARIEEVNPDVNAVTVTLADEARAAAAAVDRAVGAGAPLGPLAGVPFSVKENIDVAGSATTWGVAALSAQIAGADAPMVARLREAGAVPIARTNLPDFAFRWDTASGRAGRTRNPWDETRTPGGSSGGEAAALASGMTPFGLGNDLGGSLRLPAQMCGIAALRPSRGRVASGAVTQPWPEPISIQMTNCQGPLARRVCDLRLALEIISAHDARDPRWVPAPLQGPPVDGPVRVAVVRDPAGGGIDPHVRAGIDRAADWLADAGYEVVDAEPPQITETAATWFDVIWADVGALWPGMEPIAGPDEVAFVARCMTTDTFQPVD